MTEKRFDIDASGNARVNAIGELRAERVDFGDRYLVQQRVSVIGLDSIPPTHKVEEWIDRVEPEQELLQRIQAQTKLIKLVAVGGFGKTLLAAWLFHTIKGEFDRSLWLNFRKVPPFNKFVLWVLQEIGYPNEALNPSDEDLTVELTYRLTEKRCLLVLDQLEAVQNTSDRESFENFLQTWQQRGQTSVVIVTTQSAFAIEGCNCVHLAGLTNSEGAAFLRKQGIQASDEQPLRELVRIAEGHPLLLNLAASWLRQEAQGEVNTTGLEFFERLFRQYQGKPEAKVEEIFATLFAELPERLRSLLLGIVVYRNPFGLEMAQAMLPDASIEDLRSLLEWAFLREELEQWTLHPLMKNLVEQELKTSDLHWEAHEKAITYFTTRIKPEKETITDCAEELEIFYHHCELKEYALADQIIDTCASFLEQRGYYRDLLPIYERLTHDWGLENANDLEEQHNLGWAWTQLGLLYQTVGQHEDELAAHKRAQILFDQIDLPEGKAASLTNLGNAYISIGDIQRAIDLFKQTLEIQHNIGDLEGEAASLNGLGNIYYQLGQYQHAINFHQKSLDIEHEIGDLHGKAISLGNLGLAWESLGQYQLAIDLHQQSLDVERNLGNIKGVARSLLNKGRALTKFDRRRSEALLAFQQAREICIELQLDHRIEQCDDAIREFNKIIATQKRYCLIKFLLWFFVGLAIVLLIAWLLK